MTEETFENVGDIQVQESTPNVQQQVETPKEKTFTESRVNELIHQRTKEASQKAYDRAKAELESAKNQSQNTNIGGMPQMSEDNLRQMMADEFTKQQSKQLEDYKHSQVQKQINDLAQDFMGKLDASKDLYPDLANRREEIGELATLVPFINETSEVAGITDHLLENAGVAANLLVLAQINNPVFLRRELKKIAASIQTNNAARNRQYPNEPLSPITPSNNTMDSGSGSIESLKQQDWLRG